MPHPPETAVQDLMRTVAREVVMARFRSLSAGDVEEKAPGDLVTIADRESEARLAAGLSDILPEARVIGEEACAADPSLLDRISEGRLWLVDPIDGTSNYAAGRTPFAIMVALVDDGVVEAGWILDPSTGRMCHAQRGGGAFVDGARVTSRGTGSDQPVAALGLQYLPDDIRGDYEARSKGALVGADVPHCAGEQYPRLFLGENDVALFWRARPWDHAAGALILTEAGGRIARFDGAPYRVDDRRTGLLAAATPALWDGVRDVVAG